MIKFFRKIRYNLMEQNKTGKYFKYAIGEIVSKLLGHSSMKITQDSYGRIVERLKGSDKLLLFRLVLT